MLEYATSVQPQFWIPLLLFRTTSVLGMMWMWDVASVLTPRSGLWRPSRGVAVPRLGLTSEFVRLGLISVSSSESLGLSLASTWIVNASVSVSCFKVSVSPRSRLNRPCAHPCRIVVLVAVCAAVAAAAVDDDDVDTGPFLLTLLLMDLLTADKTCRSRVINVSSHAHGRAAPVNADDLMLTQQNYDPYYIQYPHSKLANILFTRQLARRLGEYTRWDV